MQLLNCQKGDNNMGNICNYEMRVIGEKKLVKEFITTLQDIYGNHYVDFDDAWFLEDERYVAVIFGGCNWSVWSSMISNKNPDIISESRRLSLEIEIISTEEGCDLSEYYLIKNGFMMEEKTGMYNDSFNFSFLSDNYD